jgi:hypothetical protein
VTSRRAGSLVLACTLTMLAAPTTALAAPDAPPLAETPPLQMQQAPAPTGFLHLTEVAPSGTSFELLSNGDVVGIHSRIRVGIDLPKGALQERIERIEATGAPAAPNRVLETLTPKLADAIATLGSILDQAIRHPEQPAIKDLAGRIDRAIAPDAPGPQLDLLLEQIKQALIDRTAATHTYRLAIRARLETQARGVPSRPIYSGLETPQAGVIELTPEAGPAVWVARRPAAALPPQIAARLRDTPSFQGDANWLYALHRLDHEIATLASKNVAANAQRRADLIQLREDAQAIGLKLKLLAGRVRLAAPGEIQKRVAGYIPELAVLDLDKVPNRRAGQHIVLQLMLVEDGKDVALLDERNLQLHKVGLYADLKLSMNFIQNTAYDPTSVDARRAMPYVYAPALTVLAKWGYRTGFTAENLTIFGDQVRLRGLMGGGALMWNEVWDPGLGLNLSAVTLGGGTTFEPAVGVSITFFKDLVQIGRGYNFASGQFYWYGGLGIPWSIMDLFGG